MSKHVLSKSTYMRGVKCQKCLYLNKFGKDHRDEISDNQQFIFDQGTNSGILARELFPGGIDLTPENHYDYSMSIARTQELLAQRAPVIYEAAFLFDGVLCAIDILVLDGRSYKAYEVKGSTSVSDTYIQDASLQYYVITQAGLKLKDISIVHINNQYVRHCALNIQELFTIESIHDQVKELQDNVAGNIRQFKKILTGKSVPEIGIGGHCSAPYVCDFMGHCWSHIPEYSVFNIARLNGEKKFDLYERGILKFEEITEDIQSEYLNARQIMQVQAELGGTTIIEHEPIAEFISELSYPLHFLDFETMMPAIPLYDNERPYQQVLFQYSLHIIQKKGATATHSEFLARPDDGDPRIPFVKQLIRDCGKKGDILTYNMTFEKTRLNELIRDFPEYTNALQSIIDRIKDLMTPFQKYWYYTPAMRGSYSIKKVLPALAPELSYANLEIQEGGTASAVFTAMATGTFLGDVEQTRTALLKYCHMDTLAMVRIFEVLEKL